MDLALVSLAFLLFAIALSFGSRLNVGVAYASDLDRVQAAMLAAAVSHPVTLKDPLPEVRLVNTGDSALEFQILVWIPDPRERGRIESDLRLDIVNRFRSEGIAIPFPQREVRVLAGAEETVAIRPGAAGGGPTDLPS